MQAARGTSSPNGTEQLIRTIFEQGERAPSAAVDPGVSFGAKGTLLILGSDAKGTLLIALGERREEDIANCSGKLNDLSESSECLSHYGFNEKDSLSPWIASNCGTRLGPGSLRSPLDRELSSFRPIFSAVFGSLS